MWYVLTNDGIYGEYEDVEVAERICDRLNAYGDRAWLASDDEDFDDYDDYDECGFDPYEGCYTYDC